MSQMLVNPGGAFGEAATSPQGTVVRPYLFTTTCTGGNLVALSTSTGRVIACLTNTAQTRLLGVAINTTAAEGIGMVVTGGPFFGVKKDTSAAVTAGDIVTRAATDTGGVVAIGSTTAVTQYKDINLGIGVVMANASAAAATCDIFVVRN